MSSSMASSAFFPQTSAASAATARGVSPDGLDVWSGGMLRLGSVASPAMRVSAQAQAKATPKANGSAKVSIKAENCVLDDAVAPVASGPKTFYNQLPDWSMLLAAITTIFLAAERQWTLLDWKPKRPDMLTDAFGFGQIIGDGSLFRQNFLIRSYEIGADQTASIETLMNHLQETALNHVRCAGLLGDGFGSTPQMSKRNLIWVVSKINLLVDHYPSWGDIVQVDTWVGAAGKNGMRRDWLFRDYNTGQIILRATSVWVMMNKHTRKLSKMPDEVRAEIGPYFIERTAITEEDIEKMPKFGKKTDDVSASRYIRKGLTPRWFDLDVNQHINNVKYIGWILESAPIAILEKHELVSMTLEYRKECGRENVLQSLTTVTSDCAGADQAAIQCEHLLQLESGADIVKACTEWRPKPAHGEGSVGLEALTIV